MPLYEHVFLARQDISSQQVEGLTEQFKSVLEENGGRLARSEYWGLKNLSYRISKNRKAHYVLMNIDAPHPAVAEMERQMGLNEDVLRFLTLRVDELRDEPSPMVQGRQGRDRGDRDRGDRGDRDRGDRGDRGRGGRGGRGEERGED